MRLNNLLSMLRSRRRMTQLAAELARRAQAEVAATIAPRVRYMTLAEARGYTRARGRAVIERQLALMQPAGLSATMAATLVDEALERTITFVVGQKLVAPVLVRQAA